MAELRLLLTVQDVAAALCCGKNQVYDLVHAGKLPFVKLGDKKLRFDVKDLDRLIVEQNPMVLTSRL